MPLAPLLVELALTPEPTQIHHDLGQRFLGNFGVVAGATCHPAQQVVVVLPQPVPEPEGHRRPRVRLLLVRPARGRWAARPDPPTPSSPARGSGPSTKRTAHAPRTLHAFQRQPGRRPSD